MIRVLDPGPQSTIQDLGRYGYQDLGFSSGGAVDAIAHRWANMLVGNPPESPTIEMALQGGSFEFSKPCWVSITGTVEYVWVNDEPLSCWSAFWVEEGTVVRFAKFNGIYAYLGVQGTIDTEIAMGSRSTDLVAGIGGFFGRTLQKNDYIPVVLPPTQQKWFQDEIRLVSRVNFDNLSPIRVLPSHRPVEKNVWKEFINQSFTIGLDSNRMGLRLKSTHKLNIASTRISEGMIPGAIEVTPDGSLILLLGSRGTLGGYPTIATVISADIARISQRQLGTPVQFQPVSFEKAVLIYRNNIELICEKTIIFHKRYRKGHPKDSRTCCFHIKETSYNF